MPRYRFSWANFDESLLRVLAENARLSGDPAEALRKSFGGRPKPDFLKEAWPILLRDWLAVEPAYAARAAEVLRARGVGDTGEPDDLDYLSGVRNTAGLRAVIHPLFIERGEQSAVAREMQTSISASGADASTPSEEAGEPPAPSGAPREDPSPRDGLFSFVGDILADHQGGRAMVDDDGDFVVVRGSAVVYVSVVDNPLLVRVFSVMVSGVPDRPAVYELVNQVNLAVTLGRVVYTEGAVILEHQLLPMALNEAELNTAVDVITSTADFFDDRLASQLGGSTALSERARIQPATQEATVSTTPNSTPGDGERLLLWAQVGTLDGAALVVLPADTVEYWLARMPVLDCRTWGQLRATATPEVYREVLGLAGYGDFADYTKYLAITGTAPLPGVVEEAARQFAEVPDEPPGDEEPFEATDDLPACADGDWPPSPMYLMNEELPGVVLREFAETYSTNFNGDFSTIPWEQADDALARLTGLGFQLREEPRVGGLIRE